MSYNITDVRDVALAQILAMEHEAVQGRHCFANEAVHLSTLLQIIHEAFHDMELPTRKVRTPTGTQLGTLILHLDPLFLSCFVASYWVYCCSLIAVTD
jgi:hypothetical protein